MSAKIDLMRPEAYSDIRTTRVELAETHISWVFLLDHDVFKLKKPVDLGFLDFRTIEQRKVACDAEVQLNARLAPRVYRGVVPVCRDHEGRYCIGGNGSVVDWAVRMARLPDEIRADELLARKQLKNEAIDAIATRLARFHADADASAEISSFGRAEIVLRNVQENFSQTRNVVRDYVSAAEARETEEWQSAFLEAHRALFDERIAGGRVRDGHGDLRLEHVYFESEEPTIIDCIEFNERFRYADVCADVAFLSMDLAGHGRVDLAERLLARYARESNDFDMYALVDFYESYRAFVRAKVSTMIAKDESVNAETRLAAEADARSYFLLALSANRKPLLSPVVVAVGGVIASGKSTIAEHLGAELSAPVIDADRTRKSLSGVDAEEKLHDGAWAGHYDPSFTDRVYEEVLRRASVVLASGRPVVLDASFRSSSMRKKVIDLARAHGVPFQFVECRADLDVCRARLALRERTHGVSDGRLEIFDAFCARFEPFEQASSPGHITIDTCATLEESLATLRARISTWPLGLDA